MQKLLSLNMECAAHTASVSDFIIRFSPDIICLQEVPGEYIYTLSLLGYHTTYKPMLHNHKLAPKDTVGVALASKTAHDATIFTYYGQRAALADFDLANKLTTSTFYCIAGEIIGSDDKTYRIATTHLPVTHDGYAADFQNEAVTNLLAKMSNFPPHILCGDMNIPRGYNTNYERFTLRYRDEIPTTYTSSLDRMYHKAAVNPAVDQTIFETYMVDYIFSQPPYKVSNAVLHFGISDHAAITACVSF